MKFRGVMIDTVAMREFTNIITTLSKLSKECVLKFCSNAVYFIIAEEYCGTGSPIVWCELEQPSFFSEYLMEGVNEIANEIYLGFSTVNLSKSLMTLKQNARSIKIKLAKKGCPCLTLEIEFPSTNSLHSRQITHDVPVTIISRKDWKFFNKPQISNCDITIELPPLKQLKSLVDCVKNLSSNIIVKANSSGKMVLQIKTDLATVSFRSPKLNVEYFNTNREHGEDIEDQDVTCTIDIKKFSNFLNANLTTYTRSLCSIAHEKSVHLILEKEGLVTCECFVPSFDT